MNRLESFVIGSTLAVATPLLLLILCWFCVIILALDRIPDSAVIALLIASILAGIVIDICCVRRWVRGFYRANMALMVSLFLICSLFSIAMFMGVPIGNLALGVVAGLYVGRRSHHAAREPEAFAAASRRVALLAAGVVGAVALPVGFLALFAGEEQIARSLVEATGVPYSGPAGIGLILILCGVLMLLQYWLTRGAAILAYRGRNKKSREPAGGTRSQLP
ncbi:MAG: hypothetical protein JSU70_16185 [Phycisphaerales bacterium]|nr:MAG: hypothetical protein JSU70_16185 [Phycisphaerales bacterium]